MDDQFSFDLNLDFLDSLTTIPNAKATTSAATVNIQHMPSLEDAEPVFDVKALAGKIASVNDLVCQLKAAKDEQAKLRKQMQDLSESAMSIRSMYEKEKTEKTAYIQRSKEMEERCSQIESQLTNKTFHFEQLASQLEETAEKGPITYNELVLRYQRLALQVDEEKLLHSKEKILLQQLQEYIETKRLVPLPTLKKKCPNKKAGTETKTQGTQSVPITATVATCTHEPPKLRTQGTQYTPFTATKHTSTPTAKSAEKEMKTQGTQYISSTTTRGTSTSAFIKTQSIGTNFPEVVPVSIEDILNEMIFNVSPLSPMPDRPLDDELCTKKVETKSVGTNTGLKNVRKPIDYVPPPCIKNSDSRPPSRNMYERVKNELPFVGFPTMNPFAGLGVSQPPMQSTVAELWNLLGHTIFALLQNGNTSNNMLNMDAVNDRMRNLAADINRRPTPQRSNSTKSYFEEPQLGSPGGYSPTTRSAATSPIQDDEFCVSQMFMSDFGFRGVREMYINPEESSPSLFRPLPNPATQPKPPVEIQKIVLNKAPSGEGMPRAGSVPDKKASPVDKILKLFPKYSHSVQKRKAIQQLLKRSNMTLLSRKRTAPGCSNAQNSTQELQRGFLKIQGTDYSNRQKADESHLQNQRTEYSIPDGELRTPQLKDGLSSFGKYPEGVDSVPCSSFTYSMNADGGREECLSSKVNTEQMEELFGASDEELSCNASKDEDDVFICNKAPPTTCGLQSLIPNSDSDILFCRPLQPPKRKQVQVNHGPLPSNECLHSASMSGKKVSKNKRKKSMNKEMTRNDLFGPSDEETSCIDSNDDILSSDETTKVATPVTDGFQLFNSNSDSDDFFCKPLLPPKRTQAQLNRMARQSNCLPKASTLNKTSVKNKRKRTSGPQLFHSTNKVFKMKIDDSPLRCSNDGNNSNLPTSLTEAGPDLEVYPSLSMATEDNRLESQEIALTAASGQGQNLLHDAKPESSPPSPQSEVRSLKVIRPEALLASTEYQKHCQEDLSDMTGMPITTVQTSQTINQPDIVLKECTNFVAPFPTNEITSPPSELDLFRIHGESETTISLSSSGNELVIDLPPSPSTTSDESTMDLLSVLKTPEKNASPPHMTSSDDDQQLNQMMLTKSAENLVTDYIESESLANKEPKFQIFLDKILSEVKAPLSPISALGTSIRYSGSSEASSSCDEESSQAVINRKGRRKWPATAATAVKRSLRIRAKQSALASGLSLPKYPGIELGKYTKKSINSSATLKKQNLTEKSSAAKKEEQVPIVEDFRMGFFNDTLQEMEDCPLPLDTPSNSSEKEKKVGQSLPKPSQPSLITTLDYRLTTEDLPPEEPRHQTEYRDFVNNLQPSAEELSSSDEHTPPECEPLIESPRSALPVPITCDECPSSPAPNDKVAEPSHIIREFDDSLLVTADHGNSLISRIIANYDARVHKTLTSPIQQSDKKILGQLQSTINQFTSGPTNANIINTIEDVLRLSTSSKLISQALTNVAKAVSRTETVVPAGQVPDHNQSQELNKLELLVNCLCPRVPKLRMKLQTTIERSIFTFAKDITPLETLMNLTQFYLTIIADSDTGTNPAKLFIYKCLYFFNQKATPMIYETLCAYPSVLPKRDDSTYDRSDALINTIQCILMSTFYDTGKTDMKTRQMLTKLRKFYNYESFKPSRDEVVDNLMAKIHACRFKNVSYAFALICKRIEQKAAEKTILAERLLPLANEYYETVSHTTANDEKIACVLECISIVIKPFSLDTDMSTYVNLFTRFLNVSERQIIQEAAVAALLRTIRFGYVNCFNAIYNFMPGYEVTDNLKVMLRSFIYKKGLMFLKRLEHQAQLLITT